MRTFSKPSQRHCKKFLQQVNTFSFLLSFFHLESVALSNSNNVISIQQGHIPGQLCNGFRTCTILRKTIIQSCWQFLLVLISALAMYKLMAEFGRGLFCEKHIRTDCFHNILERHALNYRHGTILTNKLISDTPGIRPTRQNFDQLINQRHVLLIPECRVLKIVGTESQKQYNSVCVYDSP